MIPNFQPFELERMMSVWENQVEYNLSESGVHPLTIRELIPDPAEREALFDLELNYPQTNGTIELRQRIAAMYPGATQDNVVVTTGAAQANFTALLTLMHPGDEIAILLPNYMQIWGIAQNFALTTRTFYLQEELNWGLDLDGLAKAVTPRTKLIAVCNPNNPTGHIMSPAEMDAVVSAARSVGAWLLADEVYAGAERENEAVTPSFWGRYEKVLAIGSLSKAYALPGLRIGWVVAPAQTAEAIWARQDYVTIGNTMLANKLAAYTLQPEVRARVRSRTRAYIQRGYAFFEEWCAGHPGTFTLVPPHAAAIAFVKYSAPVNSTRLVEQLIREQKLYVVPGDHFGYDQHLRLSYGLPQPYVQEGLDRLYQALCAAGKP